MIDELGKSLTANDVAKYTGLSVTTVRLNYSDLGGVKVGSRYVFFERNLVNAVLQQNKKKMDRTNHSRQAEKAKGFQNESRSKNLGERFKKVISAKSDKHHLLA